MKWDGRVPFKDNKMMEYLDWWCEQKCNPSSEDYDEEYDKSITWRKDIFTSTLKYITYSKGRASVRFYFIDIFTNTEYSMSLSAFTDCIYNLKAGTITDTFRFWKQGQNFGIGKA